MQIFLDYVVIREGVKKIQRGGPTFFRGGTDHFVKLQSKVQSLGLGVDFVFPLSEQQEQEEPPPKYTRMKHPRSLKFDT